MQGVFLPTRDVVVPSLWMAIKVAIGPGIRGGGADGTASRPGRKGSSGTTCIADYLLRDPEGEDPRVIEDPGINRRGGPHSQLVWRGRSMGGRQNLRYPPGSAEGRSRAIQDMPKGRLENAPGQGHPADGRRPGVLIGLCSSSRDRRLER